LRSEGADVPSRHGTTPSTADHEGPARDVHGDVYFDVYAKGEGPSRIRVNIVRFAPGARTAWHSHARGQTLHVTEGVGLIQARDGEVMEIRAGDTIYTPPGQWHWHGAAPGYFMAHLAMWEGVDDDEPESEWGDHVDDREYPGR
jgi:quercetin dioxygenase-like cupin family protein